LRLDALELHHQGAVLLDQRHLFGAARGGFALRIDSNRKLLDNVANIAWNNLPLDYLDTWTQRVEQLSAQDIQAAFARKLQPAKMVTVVLGAVETAR
jgi:zinc protease